jgi:hypothetical protein
MTPPTAAERDRLRAEDSRSEPLRMRAPYTTGRHGAHRARTTAQATRPGSTPGTRRRITICSPNPPAAEARPVFGDRDSRPTRRGTYSCRLTKTSAARLDRGIRALHQTGQTWLVGDLLRNRKQQP